MYIGQSAVDSFPDSLYQEFDGRFWGATIVCTNKNAVPNSFDYLRVRK